MFAMAAAGFLPKAMSFSWTGSLNRVTEVSLADHTIVKMQRLTQRVARMWFENVEGQEIDVPEGVVLQVVVGQVDGGFQYEDAGQMPRGFVFEDDRKYHLLQHNVIQINLGAMRTSYLHATNDARIVRADRAPRQQLDDAGIIIDV